MKINFFIVSCFLITTEKGVRIIADPYYHNYRPDNPPPGLTVRPPIAEQADVVTMTHGHANNGYMHAVKGVPQLYTGGAPAEIKGVKFSGVTARHLYNHGKNTIIGIEADGIRIWHMGDFGQDKLYDEQLARMGGVDILMTPWLEWTPTILGQLKPKVVLPMKEAHVDNYMRSMKGFSDLTGKASELEFTSKTLPSEMKVIMLQPSLERDIK